VSIALNGPFGRAELWISPAVGLMERDSVLRAPTVHEKVRHSPQTVSPCRMLLDSIIANQLPSLSGMPATRTKTGRLPQSMI